MTPIDDYLSITKFYGSDWAAMVFSFLQIYLLGNKRPSGFIFGMLANLCWAAFGLMVASIANPVANVVFFILNVRGYRNWKRAAAEQP